jgi:hypothetical protein
MTGNRFGFSISHLTRPLFLDSITSDVSLFMTSAISNLFGISLLDKHTGELPAYSALHSCSACHPNAADNEK